MGGSPKLLQPLVFWVRKKSACMASILIGTRGPHPWAEHSIVSLVIPGSLLTSKWKRLCTLCFEFYATLKFSKKYSQGWKEKYLCSNHFIIQLTTFSYPWSYLDKYLLAFSPSCLPANGPIKTFVALPVCQPMALWPNSGCIMANSGQNSFKAEL